jgi:hypothetical protein
MAEPVLPRTAAAACQTARVPGGRRVRVVSVVLVVGVLPVACSGSGEQSCRAFISSAYDPQAWPHPSPEAAIEAFLESETARTAGVTGEFEFERIVPATSGHRMRLAVFGAMDGPAELHVQNGGPGWAVSGYHSCPSGD